MKHETQQYNFSQVLQRAVARGDDPYPLIVEIHPTDACNLACSFCFGGKNGYRGNSRQPTPLSVDQYGALFKEMKTLGIQQLSISGGGEPFVDPRTVEIMQRAEEQGLVVRVVTNGTIATQRILDRLLAAQEVRFSLNAFAAETYAALKGHHTEHLYHKALDTLKSLVQERKQRGKTVQIGVTFLISRLNIREALPFAIHMVQVLGVDRVIFKYDIFALTALSQAEQLALKERIEAAVQPIIQAEQKVEFRLSPTMDLAGLACFVPYFKIALNPYGAVYSCCLGSQPGERNGFRLGDLQEANLQTIWAKTAVLRRHMQQGVHCQQCNHTDYLLNQRWVQAHS